MNKVSKEELLDELGRMLRDLFQEHQNGAPGSRLARAHGYIDGYMRGAVESGMLTQRELLSLVSEQRADVRGPAIGTLNAEPEAA
jgi:hypothetical protein